MEIDRVKRQIATIVDQSTLSLDDKAGLLFALSFELVRAGYGTPIAANWARRMVEAGLEAERVRWN